MILKSMTRLNLYFDLNSVVKWDLYITFTYGMVITLLVVSTCDRSKYRPAFIYKY